MRNASLSSVEIAPGSICRRDALAARRSRRHARAMPRRAARQSRSIAVIETQAPKPVSAAKRVLSFGQKWNYAPAPEAVVIKPHARYSLFIGGKLVEPRDGTYFPSINPATEQPLAEIAQGSAADIDAAVTAARRAYDRVWSKT